MKREKEKIASDLERKIKVGMVQINNSFTNQNYFPYSIGTLQAYAQKHLANIDDFEFSLPVYKRLPLELAVDSLSGSDIIFFSSYVWNFNLSSEIAKKIKEKKPETLIVFGGCQIPRDNIGDFLRKNQFIDLACYGEGEKPFTSILENFKERDWSRVPSISYIRDNEVIKNPTSKRISDLSEIPSPYLAGVFDPLMKANPQEIWLGLWETNRGCPFSCSFCEWGEDYQRRMYTHDLEKLFKEIDWFSRNKIEFIFCCDSNFGILSRDLEIAKKVAENKRKYGYPKRLSVQNTKNSTEASYKVQKILAESGLSKGVNLAFQSLNPATLEAIGRKNISTRTFHELQQRFSSEDIETFSDIILGLPNETYQTFTDGISTLIQNGQHNKIQFINLSILPNSEMADPEYQRKYGFKIIESKMSNIHGSITDKNEISEIQQLVVGTNTMPPEDWVKTRNFSWMTSFLYFDKLLQIPFTILNNLHDISYKELLNDFLTPSPDTPLLSNISSFFTDKSVDVQKGGPESYESKKWLGIRWHADELKLIELCTQDKLGEFYREAGKKIENILIQKNISYDPSLLRESLLLNRNLMKLPFQNSDLTVEIPYNLWDFHRGCLTGDKKPLTRGEFKYTIDRTTEKWDSWEDWCQKVIWYGSRKGAYIYSFKNETPSLKGGGT